MVITLSIMLLGTVFFSQMACEAWAKLDNIHSFCTVRRAQAWDCPSMGPRLTVVFLTFSVPAQGGGGCQRYPPPPPCPTNAVSNKHFRSDRIFLGPN